MSGANYICGWSLAAAVLGASLAAVLPSKAAENGTFRVEAEGAGGVMVRFELPGWTLDPLEIRGVSYSRLTASGAEVLSKSGYPPVPVYTAVVAVPSGGNVSSSFGVEDRAVVRVAPLEPALAEQIGQYEASRAPLLEALSREYLTGGEYPSPAVTVSAPQRFGDYSLVRVSVKPFSYDPASGRLTVRRALTVSLGFNRPSGAAVAEETQAPQTTEPRYRGLFLNWKSAGALREKLVRPAAASVSPFDRGPNWAAVRVDSSDIYALSGSELAAAGVDLNGAPPSSLRLFTGPGRMLSEDPAAASPDLQEVAIRVTGAADGSFDLGDKLIFYGQGLDRFTVDDTGAVTSLRHRYDNHAVYWLSWGDPAVSGLRMAVYDGTPVAGASNVTSAERWFHFERNTAYFPDLQPEEPKSDPVPDYWAWVESSDQGGQSRRSFDLPVAPTGAYSLRCQFYGSVSGELKSWSLNLNSARVTSGFNYSITALTTGWLPLPPGYITAGTNSFSLQGQDQVLGYFELRVEAPLELAPRGRILFHHPVVSAGAYQISETGTPETEVYDLTDPDYPVFVTGLERVPGGGVRFSEPATGGHLRSFAALADSSYARPVSVTAVTPPGLRSLSGAEYLIVAPRSLLAPARDLAAFHDASYSTRVVVLEDIYDEFSLGPADPAALRDFLHYAFDSWSVRPRFVVLFGDGHGDFRGYTTAGRSRPNRILPYITDQDIAVDEWFVRFTPDGLPQIALGRLPVQQVSDAATVVDKIVRYGEGRDTGDWVRRVILAADDGYVLGGNCDLVTNHVPGSEELDSLFPEDLERKKVYLDSYPFDPPEIGTRKPAATRDLLDWWNRGALVVNYLGHGSSTQWAQELVFDVERDLPMLNQGYRLPLVLNSSCSIGHFDDYRADAMAERLVTHAGGGALAVYAGTRVTFASQNLALNHRIVAGLFGPEGLTVGEAALQARLGLGALDRGNAERYLLLGDPAQVLHSPGRNLTFALDGVGALKPGEKVNFSGTVVDLGGTLDGGFSGVAQVRFMGGSKPVTVSYQCNFGSNKIERQVDFVQPGAVLFDGTVTVSGGRYGGAFVLPVNLVSSLPSDSQAIQNGSFAGYATSESRDAAGAGARTTIANQGVSLSDSAGPAISLLYRGRALRDGDRVGVEEPLVMQLKDESGINTTDLPGFQVALEVDEGTAYAADLTGFFRYRTDSYQEGTVNVDLHQVSQGLHSFRFRAADNALNASRVEIMLYVSAGGGALSLGQVLNYPNPFRDETDICFDLSESADVLVRIFSVAGRPVRELHKYGASSGFNTLRWDGRDEYQQKVANGVYLYKIICRPTSDTIAGTEEVEATGKALLSR